MISEFGHLALILAALVCGLQIVFAFRGVSARNPHWIAAADRFAIVHFLLIAVSFATLVYAFLRSDFSVLLVQMHSHSLKPLLYKLTGVWGNHEGSMLLWVLILSGFGASIASFGKNLSPEMRARVISVQGAIGLAFLSFILFTSPPFTRLISPPLDGQGLNPLLQDPGLAFHPPFLYLGYVGLSVAYSFAIAALWEGRVDALWGRWVRPWTLTAWIFLTIGVALGSWWAYYELGWGGFWFWDPVENASLIPWLLATALLHCTIVVEKRGALQSWTILLAIMAFGFSLFGTFIVRSGILTSVHAFANDPERGLYLLSILALFLGGGLALYAFRAPYLKSTGLFDIFSRESALVLNNVILAIGAVIIFLGTIWPLMAAFFTNRTLSVGPPFFESAFVPFMILLGVFLPLGASAPWKRAKPWQILRRFLPVAALAIAIAALVWAMQSGRSGFGPIAMGLGSWLIAGTLNELWLKSGKNGARARAWRLLRLQRAEWGKAIAHGGLGVLILGIGGVSAWEREGIWQVALGQSVTLGAYQFTLEGVAEIRGANYIADRASVRVKKSNAQVALLAPEIRAYPIAGTTTTEAAIAQSLARDIYVVIARPEIGDGWVLRVFIKPLVNWIWIGALLMALGGGLSLSDRHTRIGAATAYRQRA